MNAYSLNSLQVGDSKFFHCCSIILKLRTALFSFSLLSIISKSTTLLFFFNSVKLGQLNLIHDKQASPTLLFVFSVDIGCKLYIEAHISH